MKGSRMNEEEWKVVDILPLPILNVMTDGDEEITTPGSIDMPIEGLFDELIDLTNEIIDIFLRYSYILPLSHARVAPFKIIPKIN